VGDKLREEVMRGVEMAEGAEEAIAEAAEEAESAAVVAGQRQTPRLSVTHPR